MAGNHKEEKAGTGRYFESNPVGTAVGGQSVPDDRYVHKSFDNNTHSADTLKMDHTLDVRDRSNPPDRGRSDLSNTYTVEVMVKA